MWAERVGSEGTKHRCYVDRKLEKGGKGERGGEREWEEGRREGEEREREREREKERE